MSTPLFLETSAYLKILFQEKESAAVAERIQKSKTIVASRLLQIEATRAVYRSALDSTELEKCLPDLLHELRRFWPRVNFVEITPAIAEKASHLFEKECLRSLDAIHLATYFFIKEAAPQIELASFDQRILRLIN